MNDSQELCEICRMLSERVVELEREIKRLREIQPCGHPTAAIFTGEARGDDNYVMHCGWCADVGRYREALGEIEPLRMALVNIRDTVESCYVAGGWVSLDAEEMAEISDISNDALKGDPADA